MSAKAIHTLRQNADTASATAHSLVLWHMQALCWSEGHEDMATGKCMTQTLTASCAVGPLTHECTTKAAVSRHASNDRDCIAQMTTGDTLQLHVCVSPCMPGCSCVCRIMAVAVNTASKRTGWCTACDQGHKYWWLPLGIVTVDSTATVAASTTLLIITDGGWAKL